MHTTYQELRERYPSFQFRSYTIHETADTLEIDYHFEIPGLSAFCPHWTFPKSSSGTQLSPNSTLSAMIFSLGLVELVSYWKLTCSPKVEILAGSLTKAQADWWKEQYYLGLGEFFYTNQIEADPDSFMSIHSLGQPASHPPQLTATGEGCLIPIGGGKDSAVTLGLLADQKSTNRCFMINPRGAATNTAAAAGYGGTDCIAVYRTLDRNMLELNAKGYLNGHTPFSAIVAFSSILAAYLHGLRYVVLSNESSANESTIAGKDINHQYSKSFKFEEDFLRYEETYIRSGILYFSLLRPWSELQIAACFARLPEYYSVFRSCNAGSKQDIWCCSCPKCLFVYLILSPFLSQTGLSRLFGENLLEKTGLKDTLDKLTGLAEEKPFECVGSREEVNTAICMTISQLEAAGHPLPPLLAYYRGTPFYAQYQGNSSRYASYYDEGNLLPPHFDYIVRQAGKDLIPSE